MKGLRQVPLVKDKCQEEFNWDSVDGKGRKTATSLFFPFLLPPFSPNWSVLSEGLNNAVQVLQVSIREQILSNAASQELCSLTYGEQQLLEKVEKYYKAAAFPVDERNHLGGSELLTIHFFLDIKEIKVRENVG